jgi:predicted nucleotidyltransferase
MAEETSNLPAIEVAKEVAHHLRSRFGATRVLLFGSLACGNAAAGFSDIDIYFEGVPCSKVDEVTGRLMCHFSSYDIDFWPDARCNRDFQETVLRTAIPL